MLWNCDRRFEKLNLITFMSGLRASAHAKALLSALRSVQLQVAERSRKGLVLRLQRSRLHDCDAVSVRVPQRKLAPLCLLVHVRLDDDFGIGGLRPRIHCIEIGDVDPE